MKLPLSQELVAELFYGATRITLDHKYGTLVFCYFSVFPSAASLFLSLFLTFVLYMDR